MLYIRLRVLIKNVQYNYFCTDSVIKLYTLVYYNLLYRHSPLSVELETENGRDSDGTGLPLTISRETNFHGHIPFSITLKIVSDDW